MEYVQISSIIPKIRSIFPHKMYIYSKMRGVSPKKTLPRKKGKENTDQMYKSMDVFVIFVSHVQIQDCKMKNPPRYDIFKPLHVLVRT